VKANVSAWAIRNPLPPILLFAILLVMGMLSFWALPKMRFPSIDVPKVTVTVGLPGAAPVEIETQVTRKVEDSLASLAGVRHQNSTIVDGLSTTTVEFRLGVRAEQALSDVTDAIAKARSALPATIDEPVIQRDTVQGNAIATYSVTAASMTQEQLSWLIDDKILGSLQSLPGVGRVERIGGVARQIDVRLDPDKLMAFGVTAVEVNAQLQLTNLDASGGEARIGGSGQAIRALSSNATVEGLAGTRIALSGGRTARLEDLGSVTDHHEEPRTFARVDGAPVVALAVYRSIGASDVSIGELLAGRLEGIARANPDVALRRIDDAVAFTIGSYDSAMRALYEGAALAVLVVLLFLRDIRATLIAGLALPLSAIPTFWAMSAMGFSLNRVTLLGITLVTGILVDDAIVEIENIVRHVRMGKAPYRAALEAADEIGLTVVAISASVIFIFVPVSFMPDVAGQYFRQFGLTIAFAVVFSLIVARFITPLSAAFLIRPHRARNAEEHDFEPAGGRENPLMRAFAGLLKLTLARGMRWVTITLAIASFALAIWGMGALPSEFIPNDDDGRLRASIELPPGSSLDAMIDTSDQIARAAKSVSEVKSVYVAGGVSSVGMNEPRKANIVFELTPKQDRKRTQKQLQDVVSRLLKGVPDIRVAFDNQTTVALVGPDGDSVAKGAAALVGAMRADPLFMDPMALTSFARPEIRIVPRLDEASVLGVAPSLIAEAIRISTTGESLSHLAKFNVDGRQIPIRVQLEDVARSDIDALSIVQIPIKGGSLPLSALADLSFDEGPGSIERYDRERLVAIGFEPAEGRTSGEGTDRIATMEVVRNLPPGVHLQDSGDGELQSQMFADFSQAMGLGIMLVFVVLILLFRSVLQPVTILASLPLSMGGVVAALLATHSAFSLPVVIGLLMLMGIVTKNAIMLVSFAEDRIAKGIGRTQALVEAGRNRARPILMTTLAMAAGMAPSAMGIGAGAEFRAPMAIAVMGGLVASTILSLVVVPSVFTVMDDLSRLIARVFHWAVRPNPVDDQGSTPRKIPTGYDELPSARLRVAADSAFTTADRP
jgi:multidrug efflux pump subunit AcrB